MWCGRSSRWSYPEFRCGRITGAVTGGRQTEMDHRIACVLLIPCHFRQFALGRERVQQQDSRAMWMELQMCWASDVTRELRMMTRARQFGVFQTRRHGRCLSSWKTLKWWRRRHRFVAVKKRWCDRCNVSMWHWLKKGSPELERLAQEFLATEHWRIELSAQTPLNCRNQTVVCCLTCHVSVSTIGRRGPCRDLLKLAYHDQVALAVHEEHRALDQVATVLMLLRVERPTTATRVANQ